MNVKQLSDDSKWARIYFLDVSNTNNHTITVKVDVGSSAVGNFTVNTTYSGSQVSKLALMMFRNASGYRLGIYLESYSSENKKPVINIFDGSGTDPKVVLGKLDGTPKVNNVSPTGYGLYSDNAFLKGTIIATSGTIGGFTLSTDSIQNGTFGQDGSVMMCLGSNNSASIGGSGNINGWTFTAGSKFGVTKNGAMYATSGKIGKYTITDSCLTTGGGSVCTGMGGNQAFWAGSDSSDDAPFHVSYDGSLYASKANISGVINSTDGSIGGWKINSEGIKSFYSHTDTVDTGILDFSNSLSLLSDTSSIILNYDGKTYSDSSRKNILERQVDSLSLNECLIQGSSKYTIYGEENEEQSYSFYLSAINGLQMWDNISGDNIVYSCNGITFNNRIRIDGLTKVLWDGADYMNGAQTALLGEKVSDQLNGIVLVWSGYSNGKVNNGDVHTQFIPKWCVEEMNGGGHAFVDPYRHIDKYFYVYDDKIVGNNINGTNGTEGGITYDNSHCVLRAVIGV